MADTFPVRCPTCNKVINHLFERWLRLVRERNYSNDQALTAIGFPPKAICCRRMFLAHPLPIDVNAVSLANDFASLNHIRFEETQTQTSRVYVLTDSGQKQLSQAHLVDVEVTDVHNTVIHRARCKSSDLWMIEYIRRRTGPDSLKFAFDIDRAASIRVTGPAQLDRHLPELFSK